MQYIFPAQALEHPHFTPTVALLKPKYRQNALDAMQKFDIPAIWKDAMFPEEGIAVEELLTTHEAARRLGISRQTFWRLCPQLRARGLRVVLIPSTREGGRPSVRYQASSLQRLITKAAEREAAVC